MLSNSFRCTCNSRKVFELSPSRSLWSTCTQSYVDTNNVFLYFGFFFSSFVFMCVHQHNPIFEIIYRVSPPLLLSIVIFLCFTCEFYCSVFCRILFFWNTKSNFFRNKFEFSNYKIINFWITQLHSNKLLLRTVLLIMKCKTHNEIAVP